MTESEVWTYNLTLANEKEEYEKPYWYKQPTLRELFNLPDLKPSTLNDFAIDMIRNRSIFQEVSKYFNLLCIYCMSQCCLNCVSRYPKNGTVKVFFESLEF